MGNPAGGIVLLLIAVYLLLAFFAGRLEWLFSLGSTVNGGAPVNRIDGLGQGRPTTTGYGGGAGGRPPIVL